MSTPENARECTAIRVHVHGRPSVGVTALNADAYADLTDTEVAELNAYVAGWFASANPEGFAMAVSEWEAGRR